MKHQGTKTIHTKRLILRRFYIGDADAMYRNWAGDPEVVKYLSWPVHKSVNDSLHVVRIWEPDTPDKAHYNWCIESRELGEAIGSIAAVRIDEAIDGVEIGYALSRKFWGQGLMTEALAAVIRFFFEEVSVNRVEARHDVANPASGRVMEKCGMTPEGVLRRGGRNNQGIVDTRVCSILKSEYLASQA